MRRHVERIILGGRPSGGCKTGQGVVLFVFLSFCVAFCSVLPAAAARTTVLKAVRYWSSEEKTRIVLDVSQSVSIQQAIDLKNNVVRFSLRDAMLAPDCSRIYSVNDGLVEKLRVAEVPSGLEILLELHEVREVKPFGLPANATQSYRLVLDIPRQGIPLISSINPPPPPAVTVAPPPIRPRISTIYDRIVVIDAGHGGDAAGAVGYRRLKEKDICLQISHKLADRLNQEPGITALLTRTADYNIALRDRYRFADSCRADAFVSIHTNSSRRRTSAGTEVFFLSLGSASDEQAKLLADLENAADIVEGGSMYEEDVTGILFDLKQNDVIKQSEMLGDAVLGHLTEDRRLSSRGVKQAPFAVLKSPITPSILVETAFINNPREAKLLRDAKFQMHLADQIAEGVVQFLGLSPEVARDEAAQAYFDRALAKQNNGRSTAD